MAHSKKLARLLAAMLAFLLSTASAQTKRRDVNPKVCAALLLKMLARDRNLKTRTKNKLLIVTLYASSSPTSKKNTAKMAAAFKGLAREVQVQGLPVKVTMIGYDAGNLAAQLRSLNAGAVFVSPNLEKNAPDIVRASFQTRMPTMTCDRATVKKGFTIGVYAKGSRPSLVVNLKAARAIKMNLDSRLLGVADVFR